MSLYPFYAERSKAKKGLTAWWAEAATEEVNADEHNEPLLDTVHTQCRGTIFHCEKKPKPIHKVGV